MKRITSLLIGCSLTVAGVLMAQQPEAQESPAKSKENATQKAPRPAREKHEAKMHQGEGAGGEAGTGATQHGAREEHAGRTEATTSSSPAETNATTEEGTTGARGRRHGKTATEETTAASPGATESVEHGKKGRKGHGENAANTRNSPAPSATAAATAATNAAATAAPSASAAPSANAGATNVTGGTNTNATGMQGTVGRGGKRVEAQQVQQIKEQHRDFHAQKRPDKAPPVSFNANFRIEGSDRWQGPRYEAFRSYHPERHDRNWYHSHYQRVELIGGGYYYWNNGYWYPAWGYDPSDEYYAYNGPIYVGQSARPPDQVIADVQAELKDMGYYQGEVDGLLGPLTRQALADYQAEHGLDQTSAIDEPTLDSLQLS